MALALRALTVWLLIGAAEVVHGILRMQFLRPLLGDLRARQVAVVGGSLIILAIAYLTRHFLRATGTGRQIAVGVFWAGLMAGFDIVFGRYYIGYSWSRITEDFDPSRGGFMVLGLAVMVLAPWIAGARAR
ncbi:MAG: hypothetical protein ACOY5V_05660 [Pseudomonadota bacterium]